MARREAVAAQVTHAAPLPGHGWLITGWTGARWSEREPPERLIGNLTLGDVTGEAVTAFYEQAGAPQGATGFWTILAAPRPERAQLVGLFVPHLRLRATVPQSPAPRPAEWLIRAARRTVRNAGLHGHALLDSLPRPAFEGVDTLAKLWPPVHLELDQVVRVPPDGLALVGWMLDPAAVVQSIVVRGAGDAELDRSRWMPIRRPDIAQSVGRGYGVEDDRLGFLVFAPGVAADEAAPFIEVETSSGEVAHKPLRVLDLSGLGAIKQFLSLPPPPPSRLVAAFDQVLGPIVAGLNAARLARPRPARELALGPSPPAPRTSLIITVHGRLDLVEYQLALFSERPDPDVEIILVLDDPTLQDEAERTLWSCWRRFALPVRALLLDENLGYAPANNVGLAAARGRFVCLLNSDVFPMPGAGLSWLAPLDAQLAREPQLGAIGPVLLYEDGTVQHRGMHFETLPELGTWSFPIHTGKGGLPASPPAPLEVDAVTGACLLLRRADAEALGGLDERYLIGDFEDADLCRRLRRSGRQCRVDPSQRLFHLERQSQGEAAPWRANATSYNAWQFWQSHGAPG